jgi:hypothetical protein
MMTWWRSAGAVGAAAGYTWRVPDAGCLV